MPKIDNFVLDASLCRPYSEVNEFFSKASSRWWKDVDCFTNSVYKKNPTKTAQQVFEDYFQSLVNIAKIKDINSEVAEHASTIYKQIVKSECLKIIGDTLLEATKADAKRRQDITVMTREEFQNATTNDRMNRRTAVYLDSHDLSDEIDNFFQNQSTIVNRSTSQKHQGFDDQDVYNKERPKGGDSPSENLSDDTSYHPSSSDTESADSENGGRGKRQYRYEWFVGLGSERTELDKDAHQWFVSDVNISVKLIEYRQMCIQKALRDELENESEILSLNYIFLFDEDEKNGTRDAFDGKLWTAIFKDIKAEFFSVQFSESDICRCHAMTKAASSSLRDCRLLIRQWQKDLEKEEDILLEVYESILQQNLWNLCGSCEDTFVHKILAPFIAPFFTKNDLLDCSWSTDVFEPSVHRKRKFDPSLDGKKADNTVFLTAKKLKEFLLVTEVKSPRYRKNGMLNDLVKLGNELKDALDKVIDDGIDSKDVAICGLLVQGNVFKLDLKYEAIYRMVLLGRFYLPRDHHDFSVFTRGIEVMLQTQAIIFRTAEICAETIQNASMNLWLNHPDAEINEKAVNKVSPRTPPRQKMARPSYSTPMKIMDQNR
ncbi:10572_t:CDS:10 [Ambispora leptoticha]|uniref:10572_t:CDS:1 n=1 Tax=Ambispora leptoticha TaxID=144679 RepID=A0A9N9G3T4_9GLOM|nr:10572_t:CDS:10 [Ambispora leptoticha]